MLVSPLSRRVSECLLWPGVSADLVVSSYRGDKDPSGAGEGVGGAGGGRGVPVEVHILRPARDGLLVALAGPWGEVVVSDHDHIVGCSGGVRGGRPLDGVDQILSLLDQSLQPCNLERRVGQCSECWKSLLITNLFSCLRVLALLFCATAGSRVEVRMRRSKINISSSTESNAQIFMNWISRMFPNLHLIQNLIKNLLTTFLHKFILTLISRAKCYRNIK